MRSVSTTATSRQTSDREVTTLLDKAQRWSRESVLMNVDNFREMYIAELQELRSVEAQLIEALPKMADMASHPELKQAI